jgi:hypothetical protein
MLPPSLAPGSIRDWQFPLQSEAFRANGVPIITDDGLRDAELLLQQYSHFVCSWTGAQFLSRAGLQHSERACALLSGTAIGSGALDALSCARLLAWSPANHYPLLALLATRLPIFSIVVEIGTMHGAAAFALRAGLDEGCRRKGFLPIDCPSSVITYNVVDDSAHNARDCGMHKDAWLQVCSILFARKRCLTICFGV